MGWIVVAVSVLIGASVIVAAGPPVVLYTDTSAVSAGLACRLDVTLAEAAPLDVEYWTDSAPPCASLLPKLPDTQFCSRACWPDAGTSITSWDPRIAARS